jgi:hypothetical protein
VNINSTLKTRLSFLRSWSVHDEVRVGHQSQKKSAGRAGTQVPDGLLPLTKPSELSTTSVEAELATSRTEAATRSGRCRPSGSRHRRRSQGPCGRGRTDVAAAPGAANKRSRSREAARAGFVLLAVSAPSRFCKGSHRVHAELLSRLKTEL